VIVVRQISVSIKNTKFAENSGSQLTYNSTKEPNLDSFSGVKPKHYFRFQ